MNFTVASDIATQVMLGGLGDFDVQLDGKPLGTGNGRKPDPDQIALPVKLAAGSHMLTIKVKVKQPTGIYVRLLDPDRKIEYGESK